jgi:acetyl esterase/lipase
MALVVILLLFASSNLASNRIDAGWWSSSASRAVTSSLPESTRLIANVTYCSIGGYREKMDLYLPSNVVVARDSSVRDPVVVYVHGGGWVQGDKSNDWFEIFPMLLSNNFVVASINYFLAPSRPPPYGFPLNIEDVACAVRFLRADAATYHVDPSHVGLLGDSAGGNLVSLEALSALNGTFDNVGPYTGYSSRVQAVADEFGPSNLTAPAFYDLHAALLHHVFDTKKNMIAASPVDYVSSKYAAPPFLIEQGENDTVVPMSQSIDLYDVLIGHGDQAQLILVQNAGHEFVPVNPHKALKPSLDQLLGDIVGFFNSTL